MKSVRKKLDEAAPLFEKGGKFEKLWPVFELQDTFLFTGDNVTRTASHVRDATDMKRLMVTVVVALLPCMFFACWNTGYEAMLAIAKGALAPGLMAHRSSGSSWASPTTSRVISCASSSARCTGFRSTSPS